MFTAFSKNTARTRLFLVVPFTHLVVIFALLGLQVKEPGRSANYLHTSGNQILDASGNVVGLSGINWFGFETANYAPHGLWQRSWRDVLDQVQQLGYNVIRLPFSSAMLGSDGKPAGIDYQKNPDLVDLDALEVMDRIIAGAGERQLRVILDNHRSTPGGGPESNGLWYTESYPESRWLEDWKMLARRYKGNDTLIGMDLRNEPFGACWGCGDPARDWRLAAEKAGNAILSVNPDLLIIVEGVATHYGQTTWWGGNLMGAKEFPVRLDVPNRLVYSPHEYPASMYSHSWFGDPRYPENLPSVWDQYWGYLAADTPILIGEFGTWLATETDRQWFEKLIGYIKTKHLNWTFWSLNPNSGDTGGLLMDDWSSVRQDKQELLQAIQYPLIPPRSSMAITTQFAVPTSTAPLPEPTRLVLEDFESGELRGWYPFRSDNSTVKATAVLPGHTGRYAMKLDFSIGAGGWAGMEKLFAASQDWSSYRGVCFDFYGTKSGATLRFEILDNRNPARDGDSAERFEYKFTDNFSGWAAFELPWSVFARRVDWQPEEAPEDGFNRTAIWGFNISPVNGQGSFQVDDIELIVP
jgi:endoglucanase